MPPALQIIVWFAGSVTNYWRMFVVLRPLSGDVAWRRFPESWDSDPLYCQLFFKNASSHSVTHNSRLSLNCPGPDLDNRLLIWASVFYFQTAPSWHLTWLPQSHLQDINRNSSKGRVLFYRLTLPWLSCLCSYSYSRAVTSGSKYLHGLPSLWGLCRLDYVEHKAPNTKPRNHILFERSWC